MTTDHSNPVEPVSGILDPVSSKSETLSIDTCEPAALRPVATTGTSSNGLLITLPTISPEATLADALAFVRQHASLSAKALVEAEGAVVLLARETGRQADQLPAAPRDLSPILETTFFARRRVSRKRWSNAVSAVRALLRACGLHAPRPRDTQPSDPEWAALAEVLPTSQERSLIRGLGRWASDHGVKTTEFADQHLDEYLASRRLHEIRRNLKFLRRNLRSLWNHAVRTKLPGFPERLLVVPPAPNVVARPLSCFPESFQTEVATYLALRQRPDAFDESDQQWRAATATGARRMIQRTATLEAERRGGREHVRSLADITTVEAVEFLLRHLYDRTGGVWHQHGGNFANCLYLIARDFVRADEATLAHLKHLRDVIFRRARAERKPGLSERVSKKLQPFDDPRLLRRLFRLPGDLYRDAHDLLQGHEKRSPKPVRAAQRHEQALMLDLLILDPMRRLNLAQINYQEDFIRNERGRIVRLWISGDRVKNGIAIDTPIPLALAKRIHTHLAVYRPHLRGAESCWLFPGPQGKPRAADNVTKTLGSTVRKALGVAFSPHILRHILATLLYRRDPNNGVVVQRKLRHANIKTTERMYGTMSNAGSNEAWQREVALTLRAHVSKKRPKRLQR
jgi:integrase